MQLKAKKKRSQYKSDLAYIRAVYLKNKKQIDKNINEIWVETYGGNKYTAFKQLILEKMKFQNPKTKQKYTVTEAMRSEARSQDLNKDWDASYVRKRNFHELIKGNEEIKDIFYQHEGIKRIDYNEYQFLGYFDYHGRNCVVYKYGDSYFLEFQSPKEGTGASVMYVSGYSYQRLIDQAELIQDFSHKGKRKW